MSELLEGHVVSGRDDLARWMMRYAEAYRRATGIDLVPGSLNLRLDREWHLPGTPRIRLEPEEVGVGMTLTPCSVEGVPAFIARTDRNEAGTGHHPPTVVEIVADVHLRSVLAVEDGDEVTVVVPRPDGSTER